MSRARSPRGADDGYILVAVLGVMLVLTGFMAAGSLLARSALDTVRVGDADVAMAGLTRAGVELTAYQLFVIKAAPEAIDGRRLRFASGTIAPYLVDEGGKADLNASDSKLLASVFQSAELGAGPAAALVACIVQLRGPDRNASAANAPSPAAPAQAQPGSTDLATAAPQAAPPPAPTPPAADVPRLRGFQSVDQLRDCPNLTGEDFHAIAPLLTVYNPDGKINILSASEAMLRAMPGLSQADVEIILARRAGADKKAIDDLMGLMKEAKDYGKTTFGPAFSVRIEATAATGRKKSTHVVMASSKSPSDPYYVLDWWE